MLISNSSPSASSTTLVGRAGLRPVRSVENVSVVCLLMVNLLAQGCDLLSDEGRVVLDEAEQRGPARVLPLQAERVEPGDLSDAAPVLDLAVRAHGRKVDPAVVVAKTGRPHHGVDLE